MKLMILINFLLLSTPELAQMRELFEKSGKDRKAASKLLQLTDSCTSQNATGMGYKGAAKMLMAKYLISPSSKWQSFKDGKQYLEKAITADSLNVELRYIRWMMQTNAPKFLGYSSSVSVDYDFLVAHFNTISDTALKRMIHSNIILQNNKGNNQ